MSLYKKDFPWKKSKDLPDLPTSRPLAGIPMPPRQEAEEVYLTPAREQAPVSKSRLQALHELWQRASTEELKQLFRLADHGELASGLEGAPLSLIARCLDLEPALAKVTPVYPAPIEELMLLWHGISSTFDQSESDESPSV